MNLNNFKYKLCKSTISVQKVSIKTLLNTKRPKSYKISTNQIKIYKNIIVNTIIDIYDIHNSGSPADAEKYFTSTKIKNLKLIQEQNKLLYQKSV